MKKTKYKRYLKYYSIMENYLNTKNIEKGFRKINLEIPVYVVSSLSALNYSFNSGTFSLQTAIDLNDTGGSSTNSLSNTKEFLDMANNWMYMAIKGIQLKYRSTLTGESRITSGGNQYAIISLPDIAFLIAPGDANFFSANYTPNDIWQSASSLKVQTNQQSNLYSKYYKFPKTLSVVAPASEGSAVVGSETYLWNPEYASGRIPISLHIGMADFFRPEIEPNPFGIGDPISMLVGVVEVTFYTDWIVQIPVRVP